MHHLPFFDEVPYLYLLQVAFMIWMLVDCQRRRAEFHWFWVILFLPGIGAWVYFFVVKARDFRGWEGPSFWPFHSRPSLQELRYRVEQTPTQANHLALAERLIEQGEHAEAAPHLEAVLAREPDYGQALYLLAQCHAESEHPEKALPLLHKLHKREPRWGNYRGWLLLRDAHNRAGDREAALAACRELVHLAPTLQHKCALAEQLLDMKQADEARVLLEKGIEDYRFAPGPIRRRNRRWAGEARRLQRRIRQEAR
jgi:hypothetical protein